MSVSTRLYSFILTPVLLVAGQDYALVSWNITPDPITVTDPGGRVVATMGNTETDWLQADFRAQYSATYYVSVPDDAEGYVQPDCATSTLTLCHLAVNHSKSTLYNSANDTDTFRLKLSRGYVYVFSFTGDIDGTAELLDVNGRSVQPYHFLPLMTGTVQYKAVASGTYYLRLANWDDSYGGHYTVHLGLKSGRH
jgi:hypothetical protein